ncbi:NlpC/P60 family protein [Atopobiaceae bacterium HCP3S3_D6]
MLRRRIATVATAAAVAGLGLGLAPVTALAAPSLDEARANMESLGSALKSSQSTLSQAADDYEATQASIDQTQNDIDDTQVRLDQARAQLGSTMRTNYKGNTTRTLLELVMGSSSPEELVDNLYYADKVNSAYASQIQVVNDLSRELNDKMAELKVEQAKQQDAMDSAQQEVDAYQQKLSEATSYYQSLSAEVQAQLAAEAAASGGQVDSRGVVSDDLANAVSTVQASTGATGSTAASGDAGAQAGDGGSQPSGGSAGGSDTASESVSGGGSDDSAGDPESPSSNGGSDNRAPEGGSNGGGSSDDGSSKGTSSSTGGASGGGLSTAYSMIGVPYVWGGTSASGVDCSGLVCYSYGYKRGRTTYDMIGSLQATGDWKTSMSELSVGDLVFPSSGHVGIYIGNGQMIHAPSPGRTVCIASVYSFIGGGTY